MEAIAQLDVNFPRVIPVEAAERLAVVKIHPAIRDIQGVQGCRESVVEILAEGEIEVRVVGQMVSGIRRVRKGIAEAGAVVTIRGEKRPPRKIDFTAEVEGIALVVVERK